MAPKKRTAAVALENPTTNEPKSKRDKATSQRKQPNQASTTTSQQKLETLPPKPNSRKTTDVGSTVGKKPLQKPSRTLYVNNLNDKVHPNLIKHSLYLLFSTYGDVIDVAIKAHNKKMRGQAHVILNSTFNATLALKNLQNTNFFEKPLHIQFAKHPSKIVKLAEGSFDDESNDKDGDEADVPHYE